MCGFGASLRARGRYGRPTTQTAWTSDCPRWRQWAVRNFKPPSGRAAVLYEPAGGTRDLRVVIDDLIGVDTVLDEQRVALLRGLAKSRKVSAWRYDGATFAGRSATGQINPASIRDGWVEVAPARADDSYTHDVAYRQGDRTTWAAISGDVARGEFARNEPTYAHLDPVDAASRRNADAVLLGVADAASADLVVTDRDFLLGGHWFPSLAPVPCTAQEGIALIGQFLRSRGEYPAAVTAEHGVTLTFNKGLFFWVACRGLLPAGWSWFSACVEAENGDPLQDLVVTAQSVFQRVKRALIARDALRWHLTLQQNNDVADDALAEVDHILVDLVGAFDAASRVAHRVLGITGNEYGAGWQKEAWLRRVAEQAPALADVVAAGSEGSDLFEVMRLMRNTVHGAGLQALGLGRGANGRRVGTAVSLPVGETTRLLEILEGRGWADIWGLTEFYGGRFYVAPDAFMEHIVRASIPILNRLLQETPVERLLGQPPRAPGRPTSDASNPDPFAYQDNVLMQLGFDPLPESVG